MYLRNKLSFGVVSEHITCTVIWICYECSLYTAVISPSPVCTISHAFTYSPTSHTINSYIASQKCQSNFYLLMYIKNATLHGRIWRWGMSGLPKWKGNLQTYMWEKLWVYPKFKCQEVNFSLCNFEFHSVCCLTDMPCIYTALACRISINKWA